MRCYTIMQFIIGGQPFTLLFGPPWPARRAITFNRWLSRINVELVISAKEMRGSAFNMKWLQWRAWANFEIARRIINLHSHFTGHRWRNLAVAVIAWRCLDYSPVTSPYIKFSWPASYDTRPKLIGGHFGQPLQSATIWPSISSSLLIVTI